MCIVFLWQALLVRSAFSHQIDHSKGGDAVMGSLCAFIFFQQALFVHRKPIFSLAKKISH